MAGCGGNGREDPRTESMEPPVEVAIANMSFKAWLEPIYYGRTLGTLSGNTID
jgi:hypothetical protein